MRNITLLLLMFVFATVANSQTITVKVYFHKEAAKDENFDCNKVHPVKRTIPKTKAVATAALKELFRGVTREEERLGFTTISGSKKGILKRIRIKKKIAYVNFNEAIEEQLGVATTSCGGGYFASIDETLKQFPSIDKVVYAIERSPRRFYDWIQVGECPDEIKDCSSKYFNE